MADTLLSKTATEALNDQLGDDWDDDTLRDWMVTDPQGMAARLKGLGVLDLHVDDESGWSPLMLATTIEDDGPRHAAIEALLDAGANVHARTEEGSTVLVIAMMSGEPWTIQRLLEAGADPRASTRQGLTPLHYLGYGQHRHGKAPLVERNVVLADLLLNAGADVQALSKDTQSSPLETFLTMGPDVATLDRLVQSGADPLVKLPLVQRRYDRVEHDTLLHVALRYEGHPSIVTRLLDVGIDVASMNKNGDQPLHVFMEAHRAWAANPVHRLATLSVLLEHGADPNRLGSHGWTPWQRLVLDVCSHPYELEGRLPEMVAMLQHGASMEAMLPNGSQTCGECLRNISNLNVPRQKVGGWVETLTLHEASAQAARTHRNLQPSDRVRL